MKKSALCIIIILFIVINTTFTCYATEPVSQFLTWYNVLEKLKEFNETTPAIEKLRLIQRVIGVNTGIVPNKQIVDDSTDYWIERVCGTQEKKVSDMTENELDALLETYYGKLNSQGTGFNSNGNFAISDTTINDYREFFNSYSNDNLQPLYFVAESDCFSDLKASNFIKTNVYNSIKNVLEKHNYIYLSVNGTTLYIYVIDNFTENYFNVINGTYYPKSVASGSYQYYTYNIDTENLRNYLPYYGINGLFSSSSPLTVDDDGVIQSNSDDVTFYTRKNVYENEYMYSVNVHHTPSYTFNNKSHLITKDKLYFKVFTSLANYQDYITSTYEPQVFYTTNYYKTENIQESAIPLEQMVNLYNCYDELCQKVLQYVKDTQNADDTAVIKKLDELIQAVYSTGSVPSGGSSGGSTDVTVNTDMSETNSILNKILEEIKKLHSTKIDIDTDTDNPLTDWAKKLSNMVKNPEININATVGDMGSVFTKVTDKLKCKFPFSIPWDIFFLLAFLADTPEVPKYEIPFKLENYGIDEVLVIDFEQFSVVSKISRMLLTILYMVALMNLTIKVLGIGKDK